jgi:DNA polymerase
MAEQVGDKAAGLEALRKQVEQCHRCGLRDQAHGVVFGEGDPVARIVFVGKGPGRKRTAC